MSEIDGPVIGGQKSSKDVTCAACQMSWALLRYSFSLFPSETACGPYSLTSERSEAARMWTDQFDMHNVNMIRSTLGQQLHSLLSLDILVMPNFQFLL